MRKSLTLILSIFAAIANCQQSVSYFYPRKVIYVSVPFTITESKIFKIDPKTGKENPNPDKFVTSVKVEGDIKVESKMYPGLYKNLDLNSLGKGGKSFNFEINYDDKGSGLISTINADQTPVTGDIITGTVNIVGGILKLFSSSLAGFSAGSEQPDTKEYTTEQKITEVRAIEINSGEPINVSITPNILAAATVTGQLPSVVVTITQPKEQAIKTVASIKQDDKSEGLVLYYRVPAEHNVEVKVLGNQLIKEQTIINESILIPQTGKEQAINIPILKKKKTFDVAFSPETGNLIKYGIKKESQVKENFSSVNESLTTLNTEISNLRTTIKADKKAADDKKKQDEADNTDKDLKQEISSLTLENQKLDLVKQKQDLLDEIAQKKKAQEEASAAKTKKGGK